MEDHELETRSPEEVICGSTSKDSPNQSYYSGKRKEVKEGKITREERTNRAWKPKEK